ncbi:hypothetical protein Bpfe_018661 [Biomphalaria pfeifferi]|uniref:Uncharacterized protein n=1 Tax=Biomphalaria pfeifferi TaxID=112525 RepID=A0AAD8F6A1_BIOPF|nr:hypothetical protein Bpfe_018661 [Biomphalaria pfeifferi]
MPKLRPSGRGSYRLVYVDITDVHLKRRSNFCAQMSEKKAMRNVLCPMSRSKVAVHTYPDHFVSNVSIHNFNGFKFNARSTTLS